MVTSYWKISQYWATYNLLCLTPLFVIVGNWEEGTLLQTCFSWILLFSSRRRIQDILRKKVGDKHGESWGGCSPSPSPTPFHCSKSEAISTQTSWARHEVCSSQDRHLFMFLNDAFQMWCFILALWNLIFLLPRNWTWALILFRFLMLTPWFY